MKTFDEIRAEIAGVFYTKQAIKDLKDSIKWHFDNYSKTKDECVYRVVKDAQLEIMHDKKPATPAEKAQAEQDYWDFPSDVHRLREKHVAIVERYAPQLVDTVKTIMELWAATKGLEVTKKTKPVAETKTVTDEDRKAMKKSRKAKFSGTCQICGSHQKLPKGLLSNHGYTVDFGWFNGICSGANHQPYEESCDLIQRAIDSSKEHKVSLLAQIENLKTDTSVIHLHIWMKGTQGKSGYQWVTLKAEELVSGDTDENGYFEVSGKYADGHDWVDNEYVDVMKTVVVGGRISKDSVETRILEENKTWSAHLARLVAQIDNYVVWQEKRIADWKPMPLTLVKG
jgi:hypothetical protein